MSDGIAALVSQMYLKIDGQLVDDDLMANISEIVVDQHLHLPDTVSLRIADPELAYIDKAPLALGQLLLVGALKPSGEPFVLFDGEVTTLEPEFAAGGVAELVVRGYDRSHRLYRQRRSRAFVNVKDSDVAASIARGANLQTKIEATDIIYAHLYQNNLSDLAFLQQRARRIGYTCFVDGQTLHFRRPVLTDLPEVTVTWGEDNLAVYPRVSLTDQVDEVTVRGWDPERQQAIVGRARDGSLTPDVALARQQRAVGRLDVVNRPVHSQTEADQLARATMDAVSGTLIEADGHVSRRPDLKAGQWLQIKNLGRQYSGRYLATSVTHIYTQAGGLETQFGVRGLRNGLLLDATAPAASAGWDGVVTAIVTNCADPQGWGRVKLTFPWLDSREESGWARVAQPGAAGNGLVSVPEVGDEVLVLFEHGDFNYPFVIGGMHNGQQPAATGDDNVPLVRWSTAAGHQIQLGRSAQETAIQLETAKGHTVRCDDQQGVLELKTAGGLRILLDDRGRAIQIESNGQLGLKANGNLDLNASGNISINAIGQLQLRGAVVSIG